MLRKEIKAIKKSRTAMRDSTVINIIYAFILPPKEGTVNVSI